MLRFTKKEEIILLVIIITLAIGSSLIIVNYFKVQDESTGFLVTEAKSSIKADPSPDNNQQQANQNEIKEYKNDKGDYILVQIGGEVNRPGVYKMKEGDRVFHLLKKAKGATSQADLDMINLAKGLQDEERIIIPQKADKKEKQYESSNKISTMNKTTSTAKQNGSGKININRASKDKLMVLYRIGPALAERIIEYRKKHGRFDKIIEVKNVSGIRQKTFQRNKEKLTVR
jgi:competence protein ComEA